MSSLDQLVEYVTDRYLGSSRKGAFSGLPILFAMAKGPVKEDFRAVLVEAIESKKLECIWDVNPHIKRFWASSPEKQIQKLRETVAMDACLYPTANHLSTQVDESEMRERPFSRMLLLGEPQLEFMTFELQALNRYSHDPRYLLNFEDYAGNIGISNEHYESDRTRERDRVGLQTFGLAIDKDQIPHIVVFLRYLHDLSPEHQQYWNSYRTDRVPMCEQYFQSSVLGDFWENRCIRNAISCEISIINKMAWSNFGKKLFRSEMSKEMPLDISAFPVPSVENFERLVSAWDKVLSDNIDQKFFPPEIERRVKTILKSGEVLVEPRGSISLLDEWVRNSTAHVEREALADEMTNVFRKVRKLRQEPAHRFSKNEFSVNYFSQRRALLCQIFEGVRSLRIAMSALPDSSTVEVPAWLNSNEIEVF